MSNYGVSLLDDIDSHLPELLYNQSRFRTIGDVLDYVYEAAIGSNEEYYLSRMSQQRRGREEVNLDVLRQAGELIVDVGEDESESEDEEDEEDEAEDDDADAGAETETGSEPRRFFLRFREQEEAEDTSDRPTQRRRIGLDATVPTFLQSLLIIPPSANQASRTRVEATLREFFEPVPIVPTQEQIASSSVLYNSVDDTEDTRCSICQDDIHFGEEVRSLLHCDHFFHRGCIDLWLQSSVRCPLCRHDIREQAVGQ